MWADRLQGSQPGNEDPNGQAMCDVNTFNGQAAWTSEQSQDIKPLTFPSSYIYGDDKHPAKAHQEIKDTRFTEGLCDGDQVHEKTLKRDVIGPSGHLQSQQVRKVKGGDAWD